MIPALPPRTLQAIRSTRLLSQLVAPKITEVRELSRSSKLFRFWMSVPAPPGGLNSRVPLLLPAPRCAHSAKMPSADQVPVNNTHSTMRWHKWVVLVAGSTGSALGAVGPPNLHITSVSRRDLVTAQVRRVVCNVRP